MDRATILHLTDLHFGSSEGRVLWPRMRTEFLRDLERMLGRLGAVDAIVFSGDLVYSGDPRQFESLASVFEDIRRLQGPHPSPALFAVPGNHDLCRPDPKAAAVKLLRMFHDQVDVRSMFWEDEDSEYRQVVAKAFEAYRSWLGKDVLGTLPGAKTGLLPGDLAATLVRGNLRIGLVGLNTAALQLADGDFQGKLTASVRQLHALTDNDPDSWGQAHDANLLITHHPPAWLHPEDLEHFRAEIAPAGRFLAHLCGHLHEARSQSISEGGSSPRRHLQGRSLFGLEKTAKGLVRLHGYSLYRISRVGSGLELRCWPREAREQQSGGYRLAPDHSFKLDDDEAWAESVPAPERSSSTPAFSEQSPNIRTNALAADRRVPRTTSAPHRAIRQAEQRMLLAALSGQRLVWITSEWGQGAQEFAATALEALSIDWYVRVDCSAATNYDSFSECCSRSTSLSFPELIMALADEPRACIFFDHVDAQIWTELARPIAVSLDSIKGLVVLLCGRASGPPSLPSITLRALDEAEVGRYVAAHAKGISRPTARDLSRLFELTDGVPAHIERVLRDMEVVSLDELYSLERDAAGLALGSADVALERVLQTLEAGDPRMGGRSIKLLKLLTVLSRGEVFSFLHRFFPNEPIRPAHVADLVALRLVESSSIESSTPVVERSNSGLDSPGQKLLIVPREVRDHLQGRISAADRSQIILQSIDSYFPKWREGQASIPTENALRQPDQTFRIENQVLALATGLKAALVEESQLAERIIMLCIAFCHRLERADRFREQLALAEQAFSSLRATDRADDIAAFASSAGSAARMLGRPEMAIGLLHTALDSAPSTKSNDWRAAAYLSLALAHKKLDDLESALEAARQTLKYGAKDSGAVHQARSIIIDATDRDADAKRDLEERARKRKNFVAANNIAIDLAEDAPSVDSKLSYLDRVIATASEDFYNGVRAAIAKAELLLAENRAAELTRRERNILVTAYAYLYGQRFDALLTRCHGVLWQLSELEQKTSVLFKLFRFSSFIWRVLGRDHQEDRYLQALRGLRPDPAVRQTSEFIYFEVRVASKLPS